MVVQHNLTAMNSNRMLGITQSAQAKSSEKLSSGFQINRAADDAAGLSISEKMRKQINGLDRASTNAQDGVSAVQTAEGALTEVHSMLQRMNELAVQAANGTNSKDDRDAIQNEIEQLTTEIDRVAETTKFNETYLLKGNSATKTVNINAHDAGLKGTLVQGAGEKSTFTIDLTIGESVSIAGADYRLYDKSNELKNVQDAVKATEADVTIDGTTYKYTAATADAAKFWTDANGNVYKEDQLSDLVGDGSTVNMTVGGKQTNINVVDSTADDAKTINQAIKLVEGALGDASSIGGTTKTATAGAVGDNAVVHSDLDSFKAALEKAVVDHIANGGNKFAANGNLSFSLKVDGTATTFTGTVAADGKSITLTAGQADNLAKAFKQLTPESSVDIKASNDLSGDTAVTIKSEEALKGTDTYKFDITKAQATVQKDLTFSLHVGADADMNNKINVNVAAMDAAGLGIKGLNVADNTGVAATYAIDAIADAVAKVSEQRSALGAVQNRLEHTIANLDNVVENTTAAESRIRDTDMAEEMVEFSKNNILAQAGQSMLAQANQSTQGVLSILG